MSKWVKVNDIEQPAAEAAAEILQTLMEQARLMLPLAAHHYREDIEHVHQLRVSCRRAGAAVQAFQPLLKSKSKRVRKLLDKLRRAAGPARDIDVLLQRLHAESDPGPGLKYVVKRLKRQRKEAQPSLIAIAKHIKSGRFDKSVGRCVDALQQHAAKKKAIRFDHFARESLRAASQRMFRLAGQKHASVAELHRLRIAGKRLRYSIELFHNAFPDSLRTEIYPFVEKIQSRLGQLNDHATSQALYQHWLADLPPDKRAAQLAARIVKDHEAIEQVRRKFLKWYTAKRATAFELELDLLIEG